jgi:hypothetical protein
MIMRAGKGLAIFLFFFAVTVYSASAATISIQVVEIGSNSNTDVAGLWETGMMDVFFDTGYIVSNSPALNIPNIDGEEIAELTKNAFEEAYIGGADYFIIAELIYTKLEKSGIQRPDQVVLKLYKIQPYSILYDNAYKTESNIPLTEEISNAKNAARMLLPYIRGDFRGDQ